jgi:flagellar hook-length control protein FliK
MGPSQTPGSAAGAAASQATAAATVGAASPGVQSPAVGANQGGLTQAAAPSASTPLTDQISAALQSAGARLDKQIVVRLSPPELGKVRITLRSLGQSVRGVVEADNADTLRRLQREAPVLAQRLQEAGVDLKRLDVVQARPEGGLASGQPHDGGAGREGNGYAAAQGGQAPAGAGTTPQPEAAGDVSEPVAAAAGGGINVRV